MSNFLSLVCLALQLSPILYALTHHRNVSCYWQFFPRRVKLLPTIFMVGINGQNDWVVINSTYAWLGSSGREWFHCLDIDISANRFWEGSVQIRMVRMWQSCKCRGSDQLHIWSSINAREITLSACWCWVICGWLVHWQSIKVIRFCSFIQNRRWWCIYKIGYTLLFYMWLLCLPASIFVWHVYKWPRVKYIYVPP